MGLTGSAAIFAFLGWGVALHGRRRRHAKATPVPRDPDDAQDRQLLKIAGEMLCLHGDGGVIVQASGSILAVTGLMRDRIVGLRLDDFVHLDDRLTLLGLWGRLAAGQSVPPTEFRFVKPDGEIVWVEGRFSEMDRRGGTITYGSALRDVTRQRLAEGELREIRDDLSSGIAAGQGTLYRLIRQANGKWRPIFFAANVERVTGYSVAEAMRADWLDNLLSLPNRALRWSALNQAIETGSGTAEYDFPTKQGSTIRVRDHFRRWDRSDGKEEIVGYLLDASDAHASEQRLRKVQEEVAAVVLEAPGLLYRTIVRTVNDRDILFVSGNVNPLTGFNPEDMFTPGWYDKNVASDVKELEWKNIRRAIHVGSASFEYRYQNNRGEWRWNRNNIRHIQGRNKQHELVGYMIDITEEKERTVQLAQASKLATLGEMATGMAHELSQPLASISMAAENALLSLQRKPPNITMVGSKLERISQQAIRAAKLIDHMRIFGRRDGGEAQPVALAAALEGALTIVDGRLRKTKVTVSCDVESGLPDVMGSLVLIEQVLINLIANASDAIKSAQPPLADNRRRIDITIRTNGAMVITTVADHAGGIHDADISKIFDPFFTTKPPGEGTGLGLSISYGIINDMGGNLSVRNSDDGAVFNISLPKLADEAPASSDSNITTYVSAVA